MPCAPPSTFAFTPPAICDCKGKLDELQKQIDALAQRITAKEDCKPVRWYDLANEKINKLSMRIGMFEDFFTKENLEGWKGNTQAICDRIEKLETTYTSQNLFSKYMCEANDRIEKLEELAQERAHLINYKSYLDLVDRLTAIEAVRKEDGYLIDDLKASIKDLENLVDIEKLRACIFDGAQTHLSILKVTKRMDDFEKAVQLGGKLKKLIDELVKD
jgi:hypothetical protein